MSEANETATAADMLRTLGDEFGLVPVGPWDRSRPVSSIALFEEVSDEPPPADTLLVVGAGDRQRLRDALEAWPQPVPTLLIAGADEAASREIGRNDPPVISAPPGFRAAGFIAAFSRWTDPAEAATARRLAAIQTKFNLALTHTDPLLDLFRRVSRQLGGTVALIDDARRIHASSGPLPMSHVIPALEGNVAPHVRVKTDQWSGAAIKVRMPTATGEGSGWLIGLVPAPHRFESLQLAALQLAAPLFDTILFLRSATHEQERAVSAALLNEALAFRPQRQDAELQGKLLGSGIAFKEDLHVVVLVPRPTHAPTARRHLKQLEPEFKQILDAAGLRNLITEKDQALVALVQTGIGELKRVLSASSARLADARCGVGRSVHSVADVSASYQDGVLALRIDSMSLAPRSFIASENFDYALRLFSEVGLDAMIDWARSLFAPLWERETLMSGLQAYFACDQNMNSAAEALGIHHNSLRYRISKAEEALSLSLRSPSAIASVFLGLTALELGRQIRPFASRNGRSEQIATGDTVISKDAGGSRSSSANPGVVLGAER